MRICGTEGPASSTARYQWEGQAAGEVSCCYKEANLSLTVSCMSIAGATYPWPLDRYRRSPRPSTSPCDNRIQVSCHSNKEDHLFGARQTNDPSSISAQLVNLPRLIIPVLSPQYLPTHIQPWLATEIQPPTRRRYSKRSCRPSGRSSRSTPN